MVVILGAGISGLSLAYYLKKRSIPFIILEQEGHIGGRLVTKSINGYSLDIGANSLALNDDLKDIFRDIDIGKDIIYPNNSLRKKYILKSNKLICVNLKNIILLRILSFRGLLRAVCGIFRRYELSSDSTVADYFSYKFGKEFLEYIIAPAIKGIYAGDVYKLSFRSVFKKIYEIEKGGGLLKFLIKGIFKARSKGLFRKREIISFEGGMSRFVYEISKSFEDNITLNASIKSVKKENGLGYRVEYYQGANKKHIKAQYLVSTLPSYVVGNVFRSMDSKLYEKFTNIEYSYTGVIHLGYKNSFIKNKSRGWGFLNANYPNPALLGSIWNSYVFDGKSPEGYFLFCLYIDIGSSKSIDDKINNAINDFEDIMSISSKAEFIRIEKIKNAIPQKNLYYYKFRDYVKNIEIRNDNLFFGGNYISGLSVGDCISYSKHLAAQISR